MKKTLLTGFFGSCLLLNAQSQPIELRLNTIKQGFSSVSSLAHCDDERLFVVEQAGKIRFFYPENPLLAPVTFLDISNKVKFNGEEGLLGLAFDTCYIQNGRFYVFYTDLNGNQVVSRFTTNQAHPDTTDPLTEVVLLNIPHPTYTNHNGGCIQMHSQNGYLYIASGDGGGGGDPLNNAQNGQSLSGKLLRIDTEGNIPDSNPFVNNSGFKDEIWAYGLRNPWRFSFDRLTNDLWIADVGQNNIEEIDFQPDSSRGGENYGWKCYEGTANYSGCTLTSKVDPVFEYDHSLGCSVTGGYVYRGNLFSDLYGRYFLSDYCSGRIWSVIQTAPGVFADTLHGKFTSNVYTTFGEDASGELYLAEKSGKIVRLESNGAPRAEIDAVYFWPLCEGMPLTLRTGFHRELTYQWYRNDTLLENSQLNSITVTQSGTYTVRAERQNGQATISAPFVLTLEPKIKAQLTTSDDSLCEYTDAPIQLEGTPAVGQFSGIRVNGQQFDPAQLGAGKYPVTYQYKSPTGCQAIPDTAYITLLPLPTVELNGLREVYCLDAPPDTLSASPSGGIIAGPGIESNIFSPSVAGLGEHLITYTFTDENGCSTVEEIPISVEVCASIRHVSQTKLEIFPNPFTEGQPILIKGLAPGTEHIQVIDTHGKLIFQQPVTSSAVEAWLAIGHHPSGIYLVKTIEKSQTSHSARIIKL